MSRRALLALLTLAVSLVVAYPAAAKSHKAHASKAPVVKSVHPLKVKIGGKLTIRGSGFRKGKNKNTVVFMGPGKRVVWVKAIKASTKTLTVVLPAKLTVLLTNNKGTLMPTRLFIRVIARKSGRAFTKRRISPIVSPGSLTTGNGGNGAGGCVPKSSDPNADTDGDMLPDAVEVALGTDPCKADTDGDGISDGFEYQSALDLNRNANSSLIPWPSPNKKPYPNPLDPTDADTDFDGDSLTLREEYTASFAWVLPGVDPQHQLQTFVPYKPNPNPYNDIMVVSYSDGDQTTNATAQGNPIGNPTGPAAPCDPASGMTADPTLFGINGPLSLTPSNQSGFDVNGNGTIGDAGDVLSSQSGAVPGATVAHSFPYDASTDVVGWMNEFGADGVRDCYLSDDEKDIDGDGLSNYTEAHGPLMAQAWWEKYVPKAGKFPIDFAGTNWLMRDSDGDGIPDGSDDQDHDGYTNIEESIPYADPKASELIQGVSMWHFPVEDDNPNIDAFNPCLPNVASPACPRHPTDNTYAPYMDSSIPASYDTWPRP